MVKYTYIVIAYGDAGNSSEIRGVFSTIEKARLYKRRLLRRKSSPESVDIETWELNKGN